MNVPSSFSGHEKMLKPVHCLPLQFRDTLHCTGKQQDLTSCFFCLFVCFSCCITTASNQNFIIRKACCACTQIPSPTCWGKRLSPEHGGRSLTWLMGRWVRSRGVRRETPAYYYFSAAVSVREAAWKTGRSWAASSEGKSRGAGQDERGARVKRTEKRCETLKPLSHFDCCPECFSPAGGLKVLTQGVIYLSLSLISCGLSHF